MIKNSMTKKHSAILALTVLAAFLFEACDKEPAPETGITMTTRASAVHFWVKGADGIAIDWGDGKVSINDPDFDEVLGYSFSHEYSGANAHNIVITGNVTMLGCSSSQLTALDVSRSTTLTSLICGNNQLTALDVSRNTALTSLDCYRNELTALDVSRNTALKDLSLRFNQLTALDVSRNTALTSLDCRWNQLTALDVSRNTALKVLDVCNNQITHLDVSANTVLYILCCWKNKFSASALNELFSSLPKTTYGLIGVEYTIPGCNPAIAEEKGWEITSLHPSDPDKN